MSPFYAAGPRLYLGGDPAATSAAPLELASRSQSLMQQELAEATAEPHVAARSIPGGPTLLVPSGIPPAVRAMSLPAVPPVPAAPFPPAPLSPSPSTDQEVEPRRAVRAAAAPTARRTPGGGARTGAGLVPPSAPAASRAPIPQREPTPEELLGELEPGLVTLQAEAEVEKGAILAEAAAQKAEISALVQSHRAAVQATTAVPAATLESHFAAARAGLCSHAEEQKAALRGEVQAELARVQAETAARVGDAQAWMEQRQAGMTAWVEEQRRQPVALARAEAARAAGELETAALECERAGEAEAALYPGDADPAPKKRAAARQVATESAADIRGKKAAIAGDLESRAEGFADRYPEYADSVNGQIAEALETLLPGLQDAAARARTALAATLEAAVQGIDTRLQVDLHALDAAESASLLALESGRSEALVQIETIQEKASGEVDAAAIALAVETDRGVEETIAVVAGAAEPFLPGIRDVVDTARATLATASRTGRTQLGLAAGNSQGALAEIAAAFGSDAAGLVTAAQGGAGEVQGEARAALARIVAARSRRGQDVLASMSTEQRQATDLVLSEVDRAVQQGRQPILGLNDQLRGTLEEATNQSLVKAKKPRTDPIETRVHGAAVQVDEAWYLGLGRAVWQIAKGLVFLVVVALAVAAFAAAFGVILTAWSAVMAAGAILLLVGGAMAWIQRARQRELQGRSGMIALMVLSDTLGVTGLLEIRGQELFTGRRLSPADRWERGALGTVALVSLVVGVRSAVKGSPGGALARGTELPPGWKGLVEAFQKAPKLPGGRAGVGAFLKRIGGVSAVGLEMVVGLQLGLRNVRLWLRSKVGKGPPPELLDRVGEPSKVSTSSRREAPYHHPPGRIVVRRGEPLDLSRLDPNQRYLWAVDIEGNFIIAPEGMRRVSWDSATGRRRYQYDPDINQRSGQRFGVNKDNPNGREVKHGDLIPDANSDLRGPARAGGEFIAELDANGQPTGRWIMNNESSYSALGLRLNPYQSELGPRNLEAAKELLGRTGSRTTNLETQPRSGTTDVPNTSPKVPPLIRPAPGKESGDRNP